MVAYDCIRFELSAQIYGGFYYDIPKIIANMMTSEEIINEIKIYMKNFFHSHNLHMLREGVNELHFHMHDTAPFKEDTTIYICDHCHE